MAIKQRFLVSFMVDARGGAMRGCRHSGVRVIIPPRKAASPMRITCRYLKKDKLVHAPPLMEGEALASRILEMGPSAAKFLGPVILEVPHFASLRGKEREIVILRSDNGETWREHTLEATEEAVQEVLNESFDGEELKQLEDLNTNRITRILTTDFPQYFAIVTRIRQEVHGIGPDGGMVSSTVVPQVQAVFPQGALTKKIKVGLQAQPISPDLAAKLLGNRVAVSPIVTVEPRRRKFHKSITLTLPVPQAASKGMINQYSGDTPTLRLLCSITGGTTRAQWEDVTGSTQLTFVNDCVSFTTTVSARFWLMDCSNIPEATRMATELYREAIHVPFMSKFVVFAKRHQTEEARLRVFCMTDDREDKTLETQEQFTEVAKSRDVEVLEGKTQYLEFGGNLCPITKSGDQLSFNFYAFRENRLPFTVRVKDQHADPVGRVAFMRQPKVGRGDAPQNPICNLNIALPESIQPEPAPSEPDLLSLEKKYTFLSISKDDTIHKADLRLSDISNMLDSDWVNLAHELEIGDSDINIIKSQYPDNDPQQALVMLRLWMQSAGNKATGNTLERTLRNIGRVDIVNQCIFNIEPVTDDKEKAVAKAQITDSPQVNRKEDGSLQRDASMDVSYDEHDIMKDAESAEEEDDNQKSYPSKGRKDLSPTYEREEKKYAAEEKIVKEEKPQEKKEKVVQKQTITQELVEEFMKESEDPLAEKLKEAKDKKAEEIISKAEIVEESFTKKIVEKAKEAPEPTKKEVKREPSEESSSTKKDDVPEKDIIETTTFKTVVKDDVADKNFVETTTTKTTKTFEDGSQSIITTKTTDRKSWVVDDGSDGEVQEKIVVETRTDSVQGTPADEKTKSDMLLKLGAELGKLDDQLEEKFNEKRKTQPLNEVAAIKTPEAKETEMKVTSPVKPVTSYQIVSHDTEEQGEAQAKPESQESAPQSSESAQINESVVSEPVVSVETVTQIEQAPAVIKEKVVEVIEKVTEVKEEQPVAAVESSPPKEKEASTGASTDSVPSVEIHAASETEDSVSESVSKDEISSKTDASVAQESEPESKSEPKDSKIEDKHETVDSKVEPKPELEDSNTEPKPETVDSKVEPKPEFEDSKAEPKPETVDSKVEPKPEFEYSKAEPKPETEVETVITEKVVVTEQEEQLPSEKITRPSSEIMEAAIVPEVTSSSVLLQQQATKERPTEVEDKSAKTEAVPDKPEEGTEPPMVEEEAFIVQETHDLIMANPHADFENMSEDDREASNKILDASRFIDESSFFESDKDSKASSESGKEAADPEVDRESLDQDDAGKIEGKVSSDSDQGDVEIIDMEEVKEMTEGQDDVQIDEDLRGNVEDVDMLSDKAVGQSEMISAVQDLPEPEQTETIESSSEDEKDSNQNEETKDLEEMKSDASSENDEDNQVEGEKSEESDPELKDFEVIDNTESLDVESEESGKEDIKREEDSDKEDIDVDDADKKDTEENEEVDSVREDADVKADDSDKEAKFEEVDSDKEEKFEKEDSDRDEDTEKPEISEKEDEFVKVDDSDKEDKFEEDSDKEDDNKKNDSDQEDSDKEVDSKKLDDSDKEDEAKKLDDSDKDDIDSDREDSDKDEKSSDKDEDAKKTEEVSSKEKGDDGSDPERGQEEVNPTDEDKDEIRPGTGDEVAMETSRGDKVAKEMSLGDDKVAMETDTSDEDDKKRS